MVDIIGILTAQPDYDHARNYWKVMKSRIVKEDGQLVTNCNQLKMESPKAGKKYNTDVATTEHLLRIVQSVPSKKAKLLKRWLAQAGSERFDETLDPELVAERLIETCEHRGYTREWINQRLQAISARKGLTDEWKDRCVSKGKEYAILTDEISRTWAGMGTRKYKQLKGLTKENLRDNMTTLGLVLNMLVEATTTEISKQKQLETFAENMEVARAGGKATSDTRKTVEA